MRPLSSVLSGFFQLHMEEAVNPKIERERQAIEAEEAALAERKKRLAEKERMEQDREIQKLVKKLPFEAVCAILEATGKMGADKALALLQGSVSVPTHRSTSNAVAASSEASSLAA